jgi:hypothetical protein
MNGKTVIGKVVVEDIYDDHVITTIIVSLEAFNNGTWIMVDGLKHNVGYTIETIQDLIKELEKAIIAQPIKDIKDIIE